MTSTQSRMDTLAHLVTQLAAPPGQAMALRPVTGEGLLARFGEFVLLCTVGPTHAEQTAGLVGALIEVAEDDRDGRELVRRIAALVRTVESEDSHPAVCAFGPAADGVALVLHGAATATVVSDDQELRFDGRDSVTYLDRIIAGPVREVRADVAGGSGAGRPDGQGRLDGGIVPAGALVATMAAGSAAAGPDDEKGVTVASPAVADPVPAPAEPSTHLPTPTASPASDPAPTPILDPDPPIEGVRCKYDHFNAPDVRFCTICGISMAHGTIRSQGERPRTVGVLVRSDGEVVPIDSSYLVTGRSPEEGAGPGLLPDGHSHGNGVSAQARIDVRGWEVTLTDLAAGGTRIRRPRDKTWTVISPHIPVSITPGTEISVASFPPLRYESCRSP